MDTEPQSLSPETDGLFDTLVGLYRITTPELQPALTQAANLVLEALGADKVDIFLHEVASNSLVAMGTSETPMGCKQRDLGLHILPIANGSPPAQVFLSGEPHLTGRADRDPTQPRGIIQDLGVRSEIGVALDVGVQRRGVVSACSAEPDRFSDRDLRFMTAVAGWIGLMTQGAELSEELARQARQQGRQDAANELAKLTRRQQEVACCIAEGLTNAQIAERLTIVEGTAANHIESILTRLGFENRVQIGVWAVEMGLYRSERDASR